MRIVAGSLRGRAIAAPGGESTRPTIDRVREALFSSLYSLRGDFEGAIVLDAFAGSGALGIEALSRGAAHATFFENDRKAAVVVQKNLKACDLGPSAAQLVQRDILQTPPLSPQKPFDLLFLDPPYAYAADEVLAMVARLRDAGALSPEAVIVYEHALASKDDVIAAMERCDMQVQASKKYGKTGVTTGIIASS